MAATEAFRVAMPPFVFGVPIGQCDCGCGRAASGAYLRGHRHNMSQDFKERQFWAKVLIHHSGCWLWNGPTEDGYGRWNTVESAASKSDRVHRISWRLLRGPIPEGLELDHLCRVRNCLNPNHLEPVSPQKNVWRSTTPILSPDQVASIRSACGYSIKQLAVQFRVSYQTVWRVLNDPSYYRLESAA